MRNATTPALSLTPATPPPHELPPDPGFADAMFGIDDGLGDLSWLEPPPSIDSPHAEATLQLPTPATTPRPERPAPSVKRPREAEPAEHRSVRPRRDAPSLAPTSERPSMATLMRARSRGEPRDRHLVDLLSDDHFVNRSAPMVGRFSIYLQANELPDMATFLDGVDDLATDPDIARFIVNNRTLSHLSERDYGLQAQESDLMQALMALKTARGPENRPLNDSSAATSTARAPRSPR